ncbi:MAG TPA: flagellar basal body rod protein FlgB [Rhizomicrobium sp.]|jgi:flagellar basal-body rod protein FlgB|nr:flagellar basal body rod protein FlgB [Rhizomicrobium sp.]
MTMNIAEMPLMTMLKTRMGWLSARQNVLSQNVANADTPGYAAKDLKPVDFSAILKDATKPAQFQGGLATTDPRHMSFNPQTDPDYTSTDSPDVESSPSGNTVSLEQEMIRVSDTQAEYQAASNLYAKAMGMMKTAIGHGG